MIIIESYILNPAHVRGGENILEPITSFGGYKANISINSDGSGTLVYNNSDYTISLQNDLIVGHTSYFTLSNVSNSDTVKLYEDSQLISTTTGNSVAYTPTVAGEHSIYFTVNNVATNAIDVVAYTLTSTTISGITTVDNISYFYCKENLSVTVKPNLDEDDVVNNIPCTITYGSRTINTTVSNRGTTISIEPLLTSSANTNTLTINCAGDITTYTVQEYFDALIPGMFGKPKLSSLILDAGLTEPLVGNRMWGIANTTDSAKYVTVQDVYLGGSDTSDSRLVLHVIKESTVGGVQITNYNKNAIATCPTTNVDKTIVVKSTKASSSSYPLEVSQDGTLVNELPNISHQYRIKIPANTLLVFDYLLYGVL